MKQEDIERAAFNYANDNQVDVGLGGELKKGFVEGAEWRINSVWHKPNEEPARFFNLLLIELNNGEFELDYKFDAAITKRWAYIKDLIPNK